MEITNIKGRMIYDSRGNPTVEVDVFCGDVCGRAAVPSGASTGIYEALEMRDGGDSFHGKGVSKALSNLDAIKTKLLGMDPTDICAIDAAMLELDGTENKSKLGANAMLGVSLACARVAAKLKGVPLYTYLQSLTGAKALTTPIPFCNIINGGKHAGGKLAMQEFMIAPVGAHSFAEAMQMSSEIYQTLKKVVKEKYGGTSTNVGDEGGFAPNIDTAEEALELIMSAIEKSGYTGKIKIALDCAASEFYEGGVYHLHKPFTGAELVDYYVELAHKYPIISIEDPFDQDDFESFTLLTEKAPCQIVGDDLLVTNTARIKRALDGKWCNALLLKVNQIGTLTEAIAAARMAHENDWHVMVSHRSGETEDTFISDLACALACGQIKTGAPCRGERTAKYNQLLRIEEESGCPYSSF